MFSFGHSLIEIMRNVVGIIYLFVCRAKYISSRFTEILIQKEIDCSRYCITYSAILQARLTQRDLRLDSFVSLCGFTSTCFVLIDIIFSLWMSDTVLNIFGKRYHEFHLDLTAFNRVVHRNYCTSVHL